MRKPINYSLDTCTLSNPQLCRDGVWRMPDVPSDALMMCEDCRHAFMAGDYDCCPECGGFNVSEV